MKTALDRYYLDNGYYPTTDQGLTGAGYPADQRAASRPTTKTADISSASRTIRGDIPYFYQSDGNSYVLKSFGADGVESSDDIDASQS